MVPSIDTTTGKERDNLRASLPGVSLVQISPDFDSEGLDSVCNKLHATDMADIRQSILGCMTELGWTINHVSVLVKDRIPRRTVYT